MMSTASVVRSSRAADSGLASIDEVRIHGNHRTRSSAILSLLPRTPPASYTAAERQEFERRLNNLAVFDDVQVTVDGRRLVVSVREKWTVIPTFEFSTGRTWADTYVAIGATEYNFRGTAAQLGVLATYEQRGPNAYVWWSEHSYGPRTGGMFVEAYYESASFRFDSGSSWYRDRAGGSFGWKLPYPYGTPIRWEIWGFGYDERISQAEGNTPPSGATVGTGSKLSWDRYTWRDLAPQGYVVSLEANTAGFFPANGARHQAKGSVLFAIAPTHTTVLTGQVVGEVVSAGNVNHGLLLGSFHGVRGLEDAFYRNQVQGIVNLELRQSVRLAERWALQGAAFVDGAVFRMLDERGSARGTDDALGVGVGARLIPTWLASLLLRVDLSRLLRPEERWFVQVGLGQFF